MSQKAIEAIEPIKADYLGIVLSTLCALHCVVPPLLLAFTPALAFDPHALEFAHPIFVLLALPIAFAAMSNGYRKHHNRQPMLLVSVGIGLLAAAILVHEPHWLETAITLAGSATIILAHARNHVFCKLCPKCIDG